MFVVVIEEVEIGAPKSTGIMEFSALERTLESTEVTKVNGLGQALEPEGIPEVAGVSSRASPEPLSQDSTVVEEVGSPK
ncbi:hypothetical protein Nepgr_023450 [Nepenthes gracilis]|uniref:Uncharacterized protein n=1 Tax=Nepenthes gracilis TaxID=150966 RepID=A0AAD3T229_NEPGR|nr:hypothetical protein Nepgr_023450 [Nepenthes gracilis]